MRKIKLVKNISVVPRRYGEDVTTKEYPKGVFEILELVCILIVVVVTQLYTCVKIHRSI